MHIAIIQCTQCRYAYILYNAAIYSTDTVPHCIVTLCSPYTVSLCSINTVSLISLKLYSVHSVTIHAYNVTIQCTCVISIYNVHILPVKYAQCHHAVLLYSVTTQCTQCECHYKGYIRKLYMYIIHYTVY